MAWKVLYEKEALKDLEALDGAQKKQVLKAIEKVKENPLPNNEGGLGKSLGNRAGINLAGLLKIKLKSLGIRVIYKLKVVNEVMVIIVISVRDDEKVYKMVANRIGRRTD